MFAALFSFSATSTPAATVNVTFTQVLQEGETAPDGGRYDFFSGLALGGSGNFTTESEDGTTTGDPRFIVQSIGGVETVIAKVGEASPIAGQTYADVDSPRMSGGTVVFNAELSDGSDVLIRHKNGVSEVLLRVGDTVLDGNGNRLTEIDEYDIEGDQVIVQTYREPDDESMLLQIAPSGTITTLIDIDDPGTPARATGTASPFLDKSGDDYVALIDFESPDAEGALIGDAPGSFSVLTELTDSNGFDFVAIDNGKIFASIERNGVEEIVSIAPDGSLTTIYAEQTALPDGTILTNISEFALTNDVLIFRGNNASEQVLYGFHNGDFTRLLTSGDDLGDGSIANFLLDEFGANGGEIAINARLPSGASETLDTIYLGQISIIPLPATLPLLIAGLGGLAALRRRRSNASSGDV